MSATPASNVPSGDIGVKPEPFLGDRSKSSEFKTRIRLFLRANRAKYASEEAKLALFLDLCQGDIAGVWATQRGEEILNDDDAIAVNPLHIVRFPTLAALVTRFDTDFKPLDASAEACTKMQNLHMGVRPVVDYITEFEALVPRTGYNDEALVYFFKRGLNGALLIVP